MDVAAIGNEEFIVGFRLAGVKKVFPSQGIDEVTKAVNNCFEDNDIGIVVLLQQDLEGLSEQLRRKIDESIEPTFIAIGGEAGAGLRDKIKRAIGVDLWQE
jgi:V/A-type H+-transporting ATPase subunit F